MGGKRLVEIRTDAYQEGHLAGRPVWYGRVTINQMVVYISGRCHSYSVALRLARDYSANIPRETYKR